MTFASDIRLTYFADPERTSREELERQHAADDGQPARERAARQLSGARRDRQPPAPDRPRQRQDGGLRRERRRRPHRTANGRSHGLRVQPRASERMRHDARVRAVRRGQGHPDDAGDPAARAGGVPNHVDAGEGSRVAGPRGVDDSGGRRRRALHRLRDQGHVRRAAAPRPRAHVLPRSAQLRGRLAQPAADPARRSTRSGRGADTQRVEPGRPGGRGDPGAARPVGGGTRRAGARGRSPWTCDRCSRKCSCCTSTTRWRTAATW